MTKDMTQGNPTKQILLFMFPIYLGNLFQNFYSIVDTIIVGRYLGVDALAAVGAAGILNYLVVACVQGLSNGFGLSIAKAYGAKDEKRLRHNVAMAIYLCVAMAVIMMAILFAANHSLLEVLNTPQEIFDQTSSYISIIYMGIPITIVYNMLAATARAHGDSRTPLYFLIVSSALNIILDILFVGVWEFGVSGAALATVMAQGVSAITCFVYVYKKYPSLHFNRDEARFNWRTCKYLLGLGVPMALQYSIIAVSGMIVQSALNQLGTVYIATTATCYKIQLVMEQVFIALGSSLANYVGQNYGANRPDRIRQGLRSALKLVAGYSILLVFICYYIAPSLVGIFIENPSQDLLEVAEYIFHFMMKVYILLGSVTMFNNTLQGLGRGGLAMGSGLCELAARFLAVTFLFEPLGFLGILLANPLAWVFVLLLLVPNYFIFMKKLENRGV